MSKKYYCLILFLFSISGIIAQEEEHHTSEEKERSYINYDFLSWGNWGFYSFLQDESDDASTLGFELTSNINIGNTEIKNITYFEVNRYSRSIPGQPIGNANTTFEGANGIGDVMTGFWYSKINKPHSVHHFAPGIAFQLPTASDPALGSEKWSVGPSFDYEYESKNGKLVAGAIFIQFWSFAGNKRQARRCCGSTDDLYIFRCGLVTFCKFPANRVKRGNIHRTVRNHLYGLPV